MSEGEIAHQHVVAKAILCYGVLPVRRWATYDEP